jgi:hypothetical protein
MNKKIFIIVAMVFFATACSDKEILNDLDNVSETEQTSNRLVFNSYEQIDQLMNYLRQNEDKPLVKSSGLIDIPNDFVSLYQKNYDSLRSLITDEEFALATAEGLEIDFEDDVIADEYFAQLLNEDREIQMGNEIYKFIPEGILITNEEYADLLSLNAKSNEKVRFISVDYKPQQNTIQTKSTVATTSLTLYDGTVIPASDIRDEVYGGRGDASKFNYWLTNKLLSGVNTIVEHNFDSKHRMKLRVHAQNYILWEIVGSTCKMQKKTLGIWWRIKAEEIRLGWTAVQIGYKFEEDTELNIPKKSNDPKYPIPEQPKWYKTRFPFKNEDYVIFRAPFNLFDIKVGDINSLLKQGVNELIKEVKSTLSDLNKNSNDTKNVGLFSTRTYEVINLIGPNENVDRNTGKEDQDFYLKWCSGQFQIGYKTTGGFKWSNFSVKASAVTNVELKRGVIYGAVKWNGKWKAARISVNN